MDDHRVQVVERKGIAQNLLCLGACLLIKLTAFFSVTMPPSLSVDVGKKGFGQTWGLPLD